jgi:phosphoribosylamine--glycine ligase
MGAYSPCPFVSDEKLQEIVDMTIRPTIEGMANEGTPYRGVLYAGLMMTKNGPFVLEYNCRFGDPEAQAILPRLKSDLLQVLAEIASGGLQTSKLEWHERACLSVVMASAGYPGFYKKGFMIEGLPSVGQKENILIFHAGTTLNPQGQFITAGGRVLNVTALGENLRQAYNRVYEVMGQIKFEGSFYRRDIGRRALEVYR